MATAEHPEAAELFGALAKDYDAAHDRRDADGHALRARMAGVLRVLGAGPGEILDAGMGPGRLCAELERLGWRVSGVDAADEMVAAARRRVPEAAERLVHGRIEALPFADASFDAVVATGVLEYADVALALRELARVLRPGGRAVVSYPNPSGLYGIWKGRAYYPIVRIAKRALRLPPARRARGTGAIRPDAVWGLIAESGLRPLSREYVSFLAVPSPLDRLLPAATARLGELLERRGPRLGHRLATQVVFVAEKSR